MPVISSFVTDAATLALPEPLVLGALTVTKREYAALAVRSDAGATGIAYCLSRDAPMSELIQRLIAPHLAGADVEDVATSWQTAFRGSAIVGRVGLVRRALGLVDIALWDLAGRTSGRAVWQLLGTGDGPRPSMLVAAYPTAGRTVASVVDEVLAHAQAGWPMVKVSRSDDARFMREVVVELAGALPERTRLVVDASFGWRDADEAIAEITSWGDVPLGWVEDPLLPEDVEGCARIRHGTAQPIAVGDEVTDPRVLRALIEGGAVDALRLDVVAVGGITPASEVVAWAAEQGVRVSGHVYPEVTSHLGIEVETFDRSPSGNPYDPSPSFILGGPLFRDGCAYVPRDPGLGFGLDPGVFDLSEEG